MLECFQELKKDKAPGIDGVTVRKYEERLEENLKALVVRLKGKQYRPQPVRRVYIPKDGKSVRPPWDTHRRRQDSADGDKEDTGGDLRARLCRGDVWISPKRGCRDALEVVDKTIMTKAVNFVVDSV